MQKSDKLTRLGMLFALATLATFAQAATYYLSPTGSDTTGNGSSSNPWRSLAPVATNVPARQGHIVHLRPGTYFQNTPIWLPIGITLQGESTVAEPNKTIIYCRVPEGTGPGSTISWSTGNKEVYPTIVQNLTFDGDNFTGFGGLDFRRHNNVTVQDNFFRNFAGEPLSIKIEESSRRPLFDDEWITNSKILRNDFRNNKARALWGNAMRNFEIAYNTIYNPDKAGASFTNPTYLGDGIQIYSSEGGRIHHNTITVPDYIPEETRWKQQSSAPTITILHGGRGLEVDNNVLNQWTSFVQEDGNLDVLNLDFHHNTMTQIADVPGQAVEIMWHNTLIRDNVFTNFAYNVLTDNGEDTYGVLKNIQVFRNVIRRTSPMTVWETAGVVFRNFKQSDLENFYVYNNVFDGLYYALLVDGGGPIKSAYVKNNVMLNCGYVVCWAWPQKTNIQTLEIANNAWHYTIGFERNPRASVVTFNSNYPGTGSSLSSAAALGLLLSGNVPSPYYTPSSATSFVVNKGTATISPSFSLTGFQGTAPDLGIFEYVGGGSGSGTGLRGSYFAGMNLSGSPVLTRTDSTVNFSWGSSSYTSGGSTDNFSVRWEGEVQATTTGSYTFSTLTDDGVRLWVNGTLVIDNWTNHGDTWDTSPIISLTAGQKVSIKMEFFENGGGATAQLHWTTPGNARQVIPMSQLYPATGSSSGSSGTGTGLKASFYSGMSLSGSPLLTRTDSTVNFSWGNGSYTSGGPTNNFSAKWEGEVQATAAGNYTFSTLSDDGVRLYVNGNLVINNWTNHGDTWDTSAAVNLTAGQKVTIRMEYFENGGGATAQLHWTPPGGTRQVIPTAQLYPAP
ncbi:MAG: PA14 domain-containing protein [Fimbriimonadaceae bacterium]|jgi:hypothetical protein|nr:PA14 domain-containing protein [Fimbriimonadaceae bacterium]